MPEMEPPFPIQEIAEIVAGQCFVAIEFAVFASLPLGAAQPSHR
jgi:hypothetical protein